MSRQCTYDDFEFLFTEAENQADKFPTKPYFPSQEDIDKMEADIDKYYEFITYLLANNPKPVNDEQKECMRRLDNIINDNTEFIEENE